MPSPAVTSRLRVTTHGREPLFLILSTWEFRLQYGYFHSYPYEPILRTAFAPHPLPLLCFGSRLFFHENFVVTQHTLAGVFRHSKNSQGADPRNEHKAILKGAFSNWFPRRNQLKTLTEHILWSPSWRFLPGLAFVPVCVCLFLCRGLGSPGLCLARCLSRLWSCLSLLVPLLLSGCISPCGRRPEDRHTFSRYPSWSRVTAYAVWDRLSGYRRKFWDFGSLFVP